MPRTEQPQTVDIRPGVGVLSVISYIRYQPWYALAEFVDNAIQSFESHRQELSEGSQAAHLTVEIEVENGGNGRVVVRDNAAGIFEHEYKRAFRPAELPPDRSGLSEFGMGMKTAACWFGRRWSVRTSALGEAVQRTVLFDVDRIVRDSLEELDIESSDCERNVHFTELVIENLNRSVAPKTLAKVKDHLASIYRSFLRSGDLTLRVSGEELSYEDFEPLVAPYHEKPYQPEDVTARLWRKEIRFDFGEGLRVHGFAALRATASTSRAGFALFRRGRVIQGAGEDTYRPPIIFGSTNSFTFQRLSGELHLEGFEVSHTKDGFRWDDSEEPFLELLKEHLDAPPLPLLRQAENYRTRPRPADVDGQVDSSSRRTASVVQEHAPPVLEQQLTRAPETTGESADPGEDARHRTFNIFVKGESWVVDLVQTRDPAVSTWLSLREGAQDSTPRQIQVVLALDHPFMVNFVGAKGEHFEGILRLAVALGLSEVTARESGVEYAGEIRRNVNQLLREVLYK